MRITQKILLIVFLALALALFSLYFGYKGMEKGFKLEVGERQFQLARQTIERIDQLFQQRFGDVQIISSFPDLRSLLSGSAIVTDAALKDLQRRFLLVEASYGSWEEISAVDKNGKIIISSNEKRNGASIYADGKKVENLLEKTLLGDTVYSDLFISEVTGKPALLFAAPIRSPSNNSDIIGAVIGQFAWQIVLETLGNLETPFIHLINREGLVIVDKATDDQKDVFRRNLKDREDIADLIEGKVKTVLANDLDRNITPSLISGIREPGYLDFSGNDWTLLIETPLSSALALARNAIIQILTLQSIFLILAALLAFFISNHLIIRPIRKMTETAEIIAKGDLNKKAEVNSRDEIGDLGRQFNFMTQKLREAYGALVEEKANLVSAISSIPLGVMIVDFGNKIVLRNDRVASILGINGNDYGLKAVTNLFPLEVEIDKKCRVCIEERKVIEVPEIDVGKKVVRLLLAPIFDQKTGGKTFGYIFLVEDITEQKVLERGKEEFFSIASHELRTPLTAIRGNASMLEDFYSEKITDSDMRQMIADITTASERLIRIVNDFLDVSRLEQRRSEFKKEEFDIVGMLMETVRILKDIILKKGLTLELKNLPLTLNVIADKSRTKQVFFNLLGNAINFTNHGNVSIEIEKDENFAKIYVKDTGIGISPQNQNLLFRKFQQAGEKILARDLTQGTGLGLYISKMIVEEMGGKISLEESTPGKGSTFSFTLPLESS